MSYRSVDSFRAAAGSGWNVKIRYGTKDRGDDRSGGTTTTKKKFVSRVLS
jgi:hypothetical protein